MTLAGDPVRRALLRRGFALEYVTLAQGRERFVADPMVDLPAGQLASWGQGIALVARQLIA